MPDAATPTLRDVLRAFNEPFLAACQRCAIQRAIGFLTDGTPYGPALALEVLRVALEQTEAGK